MMAEEKEDWKAAVKYYKQALKQYPKLSHRIIISTTKLLISMKIWISESALDILRQLAYGK